MMKKIIFILFVLFLGGCGNAISHINQEATVILYIDSQVEPEITYSRGVGTYDSSKKEFELKVKSIAPVDICLSYDGYLSKTISISSEELLSGLVEKNITFKETKKTMVSIRVITEAPLEDVEVLGWDFVQEEDYFTTQLPSRDQFLTITIRAGIDYQEKTIQLTPDDLITGVVKKEIILPRTDQVILSTDKANQYLLSVRKAHTDEVLMGIPAQGKYHYVVEKNQEIYYFNYFTRKTHYMKLTQDQYLTSIDDGMHYRSYTISASAPTYIKNNLYYELNNHIYPAPISIEGKDIQTIYISVYAELFFVSFDESKIYFHYHKGFAYGNPFVSIMADDFLSPVPHPLKINYFDAVNGVYLEEISIDEVIYQADENHVFTQFEQYPSQIDGYVMANELDAITSASKQEETWESTIYLFPQAEGIIIHIVDQNGTPLDAEIDNVTYTKVGTDFVLTNLLFDPLGLYEYQLLNIKYQDSYYYENFVLFAQMLEVVETEGKVYLEYLQPIALQIP
jgi:hypothetical protein